MEVWEHGSTERPKRQIRRTNGPSQRNTKTATTGRGGKRQKGNNTAQKRMPTPTAKPKKPDQKKTVGPQKDTLQLILEHNKKMGEQLTALQMKVENMENDRNLQNTMQQQLPMVQYQQQPPMSLPLWQQPQPQPQNLVPPILSGSQVLQVESSNDQNLRDLQLGQFMRPTQ